MAKIVVETLEESDQADLPGIEAWLSDYRAAAKDFENPPKPGQLPPLDVEKLVTHNPNFWLAHYEVAPGDIGLNCLHAGLLLAAGEARRAQCLLAIAEQRPGIPAEFGKNIGILIAHCDQAGEASNALVAESIKLHDAGDYAAAVTKLNEALALWPQNGFAHYELGLTLYQQQRKAAGAAALANSETKIQINSGLPQSPEVQAEYALARRHDPFQFRAWQGTDQNVIQGLVVLLEKGMPAWEKLMETRPRPVSDETLEQLAAALQESGTHDLALVTRQVLIARRGRYDRPDHPFMAASLKKLAPGDEIDALLDRLWSGPLKARQLVVPE
jgi:tetratricopeptide (TPR) repeat protein